MPSIVAFPSDVLEVLQEFGPLFPETPSVII